MAADTYQIKAVSSKYRSLTTEQQQNSTPTEPDASSGMICEVIEAHPSARMLREQRRRGRNGRRVEK